MSTIHEPVALKIAFPFDNSFARELPGFYVSRRPAVVRAPGLPFLNGSLAEEIALDSSRSMMPRRPRSSPATACQTARGNRVIARNHRVEEALAAASDEDDLAPFERLLDVLRHSSNEVPALPLIAEPAPPGVAASHRTFCGT